MKHSNRERQGVMLRAERQPGLLASNAHEQHEFDTERFDHSPLSLFARYYRLVLVFIALSALYIYGAVFMPFRSSIVARYDINPGHALLTTLAIYIPFVCIWFIGLMGYLQLRDYTEQILHSRDGRAFRYISRGVFVLTTWLPVSALLNLLTAYHRYHPFVVSLIARASNYANVAMLLLAFVLVYVGSRRLLRMIHQSEPSPLFGAMAFIAFAIVYTYITFHNSGADAARQQAVMANFYLPDRVVLLTVVIPRLVSWYIGVRAVYNLYAYRINVVGKLYKQALTSLSIGLAGVVILSALYRSTQSIIPKLQFVNVAGMVALLYSVLLALSIGYVLVAHGVRNLQRIEKL